MRIQIYAAISILMVSLPVFTYAGFPEPDAIFYGTVSVAGKPVSAEETVTASKTDGTTKIIITEVTVSDGTYVLRIPVDSSESQLGGRPHAVQIGDTVTIDIAGQKVAESPVQITERGLVQRVNLHTGSIPITFGEVDGTPGITESDAERVMAHVSGRLPLPGSALRAADVTGDGKVTAYDAALILQFAAGLIAKFPAEGTDRRFANRAIVRRVTVMALGDNQTGQFVMPVQIEEANGGIAYELSLSYDADLLEIQEVRKVHPDDLLEYQAGEGNLKIALVRTEPIQGRGTEIVVVGTLRTSQSQPVSLALNRVALNEGNIPLQVSVLGERMTFDTPVLGSGDEAASLSATVPIHCVKPTYGQMYFYGLHSTFNGEPLQPGDVVLAKDPQGTFCGYTLVDAEGRYGYMTVYSDDKWTEIDEGLEKDDPISFYINGYQAGTTGLDAPPKWTGNWRRKEIDLFTWVKHPYLTEGWNLVALPLQPHQPDVEAVLKPIEGQYEVIQTVDGSATFDPLMKGYSDLKQLDASQMYRIKMKTSTSFVMTGVPTGSSRIDTSGFAATPTTVDVWGTVDMDGQPAPAGTVITATDRFGVELGRFVVNAAGSYGFLHLPVGDDHSINSSISEIQFQVNGVPVSLNAPFRSLSPSERDRMRLDFSIP